MLVPTLLRSPSPAVFRTAGFPMLNVEICRRHVYIIFLSIAVVPDRNIGKCRPGRKNAVEADGILRYYVNKFCEQIVLFRLVSAWPAC